MFITEKPILRANFLKKNIPEDCGGEAVFFGVVRDHHQGKKVQSIRYECFKPLAEKEIERITKEVQIKTKVQEITVLHRVGRLKIGDVAVAIRVASAHRDEAFTACRLVIDRIKETVPIWKKESYKTGETKWVHCHETG